MSDWPKDTDVLPAVRTAAPRPVPSPARPEPPDPDLARQIFQTLFGISPDASPISGPQLNRLETEEITGQMDSIRREVPIRLVSIAVISLICLFYVPPWLVVTCVALTLIADRAEAHFFARFLARPDRLTCRRAAIACVYLGEIGFCLPASLIWHVEDPFSKSISIGIFAAAMMRLATTRSIYPATGFAGLTAQITIMAIFNSYYWLHRDLYGGFVITSLIALTSVGYVAAAILRNHQQQRQSAASRYEAESASLAKSQFLARMSHELRTPLNAIIGMGVATEREALTDAGKSHLTVLVKSAKSLATLLDDALDTAAITENRIVLRPRAGALREELHQAVSLFQAEAARCGINLTIDFSAALPEVLRLDFDRLRQCMSNLLSNALRHTPGGKVTVSVNLDATGLLQICVQDNGEGLPPGLESQIFNAPSDTGHHPRRHGIGLGICRAILHQMGGEIEALPSASGATFRIRVPWQAAAEPELALPPARAPGHLAKRVLVVDDIATNRLVASTYLRMLHCTPVEAPDGREALRLLQADPGIDLVLLDMNMPDMDGAETFVEITRLSGPARACPVIAMTADSADHDRLHYLGLGLAGYVSKPIDLAVLEAEMRRVLADG